MNEKLRSVVEPAQQQEHSSAEEFKKYARAIVFATCAGVGSGCATSTNSLGRNLNCDAEQITVTAVESPMDANISGVTYQRAETGIKRRAGESCEDFETRVAGRDMEVKDLVRPEIIVTDGATKGIVRAVIDGIAVTLPPVLAYKADRAGSNDDLETAKMHGATERDVAEIRGKYDVEVAQNTEPDVTNITQQGTQTTENGNAIDVENGNTIKNTAKTGPVSSSSKATTGPINVENGNDIDNGNKIEIGDCKNGKNLCNEDDDKKKKKKKHDDDHGGW